MDPDPTWPSRCPDPVNGPARDVRIPQLDGLRGLAILLVLIWHYIINNVVPAEGTALAVLVKSSWLGSTGVDLFFVMSGFLLGGILLDHAESPRYLSTFYLRRAARILPVYFVLLIAFYLARALVPPATNAGTDLLFTGSLPWWSYFSFTQNFFMAETRNFGAPGLAVTWSLAIEEQFYLVLPLLLRFVPERRLNRVLLFFIIAAPLWRVGLVVLQDPTGASGFLFMPARADSLLAGVLAARLLRVPHRVETLRHHRSRMYALFLLSLGLTLGLGLLGNWYSHVGLLLVGHTWLACFYAFIILLAVTEATGPLSRLASHAPLRWLGLISYGVYLFHQPVLILMHGWFRDHFPGLRDGTDVAITLLALIVTLLLATVSWFLFEKPLVHLGRRARY